MNYFNHSLLIFSVFIIGLHYVTSQNWDSDTPSVQDCQTFCFADCSHFYGNDFSTCVTANIHCSCGLPPVIRLGLAVIGAIVGFIIMGHCIRKCKERNYQRTNTATATGPIRPNIECLPQQIVTRPSHTHNPISPNVPVFQQQLPYYNPGVPNSVDNTFQKRNNEDPPSYDEVVRGDAIANQRGS